MSKRTDRAQERNAAARAVRAAARGTVQPGDFPAASEPVPEAPREPRLRLERLREPEFILAIGYLVLLIGVAWHYLSGCLVRTWFYASDEYVAIAEVIRFSIPDFHQRFIDWPGVPLIFMTSVIWGMFARIAAGAQGWLGFTYQHIAWLFETMRFLTIGFYCLSLVLVFLVTRRALNTAGACVASLLLLMNPTYVSYSSFVRPESIGVCLILGAALLTYRGMDQPSSWNLPPHWRDSLTWAGVLMGVAVGVRLNTLVAAAPLVWMIVALRKRESQDAYPVWIRQMAVVAVPVLAVWGLWAFQAARAQGIVTGKLPAYGLLANAALAIACAPLPLTALYWIPRTRRIAMRLAPPEAIKIALGSVAGLVIGFPTVFSQFSYLVDSMEMYSTSFIDWYRTKWPLAKNLRWYLANYLDVAAHDRIVLYLLIAGVILILLLRDRRALPYVIGAATFFVSKPLNLQAAAHHMIFWIPMFVIVASYPVALIDALWRERAQRWAVDAALVALLAAMTTQLTNGPQMTEYGAKHAEGRMASIVQATAWMKGHLAPGDSIATAYACFNSDVFYKWVQDLGVPVPAAVFDPHRFMMWWGRRNEIAGRAGFACITEGDIEPIRRGTSPQDAGQAADPYHERVFQPVASFGKGDDKVDVFHFDLRALR